MDETRGAEVRTETQTETEISDAVNNGPGPVQQTHTSKVPYIGKPSTQTDTGNSRTLAALHGRDLRHLWGDHDGPLGWLVWDGRRYSSNAGGELMRRAKKTAEYMLATATQMPVANKDQLAKRQQAIAWCLSTLSAYRLKAMVDLAASEVGIAARPTDFDSDPWNFNVQNGTLDLKTGKLRPHNHTDQITKLAPAVYDSASLCPKFDAFLKRIFNGNVNVIGFVQRAIGYSLTGCTDEDALFLLYGTGCNGKTTLILAVREMLGDYAQQASTDLLLSKKQSDHPTAVAGLRGARLVTAVEVDEGRRLAEGLVKQMTGGDRMSARKMRQDYFEFEPTFKIFLAVNHKPIIHGTDHAIWRRIMLIPFNVKIPPEEKRDRRELLAEFAAERPGILAWAMRGCLEWQRDGLRPPGEVAGATEEYRAESDALGRFIEEACEISASGVVGKGALTKAYKEWAESEGELPLSGKALAARMRERGFVDARQKLDGRAVKLWRGIQLAEIPEAVTSDSK